MTQVQANGIEIEYDTFGTGTGRPLVLIMGLGTQMIAWPDAFCRKLADHGHFVVRFDNRDTGLSAKMDHAGVPNVMKSLAARNQGRSVEAPYNLSDMAADAIGLMDAIGLKTAHVCGFSMGGMIAQTMAIEYPDRMLSLISMGSGTGEASLPDSTPEALEVLFASPPLERDANIRHRINVFRVFAGGSDKFDEALEREISEYAFDRDLYLEGFARQFAAIVASGSRKQALNKIRVPTLVIHGAQDPVALMEHGVATADAIEGAGLHIVEGLGHGLSYPRLWDNLVDAIAAHTARIGLDPLN